MFLPQAPGDRSIRNGYDVESEGLTVGVNTTHILNQYCYDRKRHENETGYVSQVLLIRKF